MKDLVDYIKLLKEYSVDQNMSDETFVNELFNTVIEASNISNKNNEDLYLDKGRVSLIMNRKSKIPRAITKVLNRIDLLDKTADSFSYFLENYIEENKIEEICRRIDEEIVKRNNVENLRFSWILDCYDKYLADVFIMLLKQNIETEIANKVILDANDCYVDIVYGDILKYGFENRRKKRNITVIPVNSSFDTNVSYNTKDFSYPLVSENTIHGKWLIRIQKSGYNLDELSQKILNSIIKQNIRPVKKENGEGYNPIFPLGTIACIDFNKSTFYLMAISDFDQFNSARSSREDIIQCIQKLIQFYDRYGQGYDLYLPLIGTGRSRAGLSLQESFDIIMDIIEENYVSIHGKIHIVICKENKLKIEVRKKEKNVL